MQGLPRIILVVPAMAELYVSDAVTDMLMMRGGSAMFTDVVGWCPGTTLKNLRDAKFKVKFDNGGWKIEVPGMASAPSSGSEPWFSPGAASLLERLQDEGGSMKLIDVKRDFHISRQEVRDLGFEVYTDTFRHQWMVRVPGAPQEPIEPMPQETVDKLMKLLTDAGGALPLGHVGKQAPGVKKAQLEQHFEVNCLQKDHWEVRIPGSTGSFAHYMVDGKPVTQPDEIPPLDEEQYEKIVKFILGKGGMVILDEIHLEFDGGVKRMQLRQAFDVSRRGLSSDQRRNGMACLANIGINVKGRREIYEVRLKVGTEYSGHGAWKESDVARANKIAAQKEAAGSSKGGNKGSKAKDDSPHVWKPSVADADWTRQAGNRASYGQGGYGPSSYNPKGKGKGWGAGNDEAHMWDDWGQPEGLWVWTEPTKEAPAKGRRRQGKGSQGPSKKQKVDDELDAALAAIDAP